MVTKLTNTINSSLPLINSSMSLDERIDSFIEKQSPYWAHNTFIENVLGLPVSLLYSKNEERVFLVFKETTDPLTSHLQEFMLTKNAPFLGEGGSKQVFKAVDARDRTEYALALYRPAGDTEMRKELDFFKRLEASNGVAEVIEEWSVLDASGQSHGAFIMPYYEESDLARILKTPTVALSQKESAQIMYDLMKGLESCLAEEIVHHDLKPENILLYKDGYGTLRALLTDFGAASYQKDSGFFDDMAKKIALWAEDMAHKTGDDSLDKAIKKVIDSHPNGLLIHNLIECILKYTTKREIRLEKFLD